VEQKLHALLSDQVTLSAWLKEHAVIEHVAAGLDAAIQCRLDLLISGPQAKVIIFHRLFTRIDVTPDRLVLHLHFPSLVHLLLEREKPVASPHRKARLHSTDRTDSYIALDVPMTLKWRGVETRLVVDQANLQKRTPDKALVRLLPGRIFICKNSPKAQTHHL